MMDIGMNAADDLDITSGDFANVESTAQHQRQILLNAKGDFKQNPTICVGAFQYLDDETMNNLVRDICVEFSRDGMEVQSVSVDAGGTVTSAAFYK